MPYKDPEKKKLANQRYREKNKEKELERHKKYREENKEKERERNQKYYSENQEKEKLRKEKYYKENPETRKKTIKKWKENNKEKIKAYNKLPHVKLVHYTRVRINKLLKNKSKSIKTLKLLGCTSQELVAYIESKFQDGMTWDNHGIKGWHVDHIIPCASFDLSNPEQQKQCFHYTNLQPLWWNENLSKGDH